MHCFPQEFLHQLYLLKILIILSYFSIFSCSEQVFYRHFLYNAVLNGSIFEIKFVCIALNHIQTYVQNPKSGAIYYDLKLSCAVISQKQWADMKHNTRKMNENTFCCFLLLILESCSLFRAQLGDISVLNYFKVICIKLSHIMDRIKIYETGISSHSFF